VFSPAFCAAETGNCENNCERRVKAKVEIARTTRIKTAVGIEANFLNRMRALSGV
jgi:hypothetical protein